MFSKISRAQSIAQNSSPGAPPRRPAHLLLVMASLCLQPPMSAWAHCAEPARPALMLAKNYHPGLALADYWVSEKYDGVRGYWDGKQLLTRSGEPIAAPAWFTAGWPAEALDGELWAGRGRFTQAVSAVRQLVPDDAAWRDMQFMVFDAPSREGPFTERIAMVDALVSGIGQAWVVGVVQAKVANQAELQSLLKRTVAAGGEGLALHRGASHYVGGRSNDLRKLKPHEDAEARVVAHIAGKGKYAGSMGALLVELPADGATPRRFKLGSGFTDAQRLAPPAVGSIVTFRYRGLTNGAIPRFATYLREAADQDWARVGVD